MATITLHYDGRSNLIKHLIEALLAAGATMQTKDSSQNNAITPTLRTKIKKARKESEQGETIVCSTPENMQQYFDSL